MLQRVRASRAPTDGPHGVRRCAACRRLRQPDQAGGSPHLGMRVTHGTARELPPLVSLHAAGCSSPLRCQSRWWCIPKGPTFALTLNISVGAKGFPCASYAWSAASHCSRFPAEIGALKSLTLSTSAYASHLRSCHRHTMPERIAHSPLARMQVTQVVAASGHRSHPPSDLSNCVMLHALPVGLVSVSPHLSQLWLDGSSLPLAA